MKPWVEWLLSISLLLLVVAVIVALVIGFVRWFRPSNALDDLSSESDSAGLEFDLGTPQQSTLWRRRQLHTLPDRKYTGTSLTGDLFSITLKPPTKTIDYQVNGVAQKGIAKYSQSKHSLEIDDEGGLLLTAVESLGQGLLVGLSNGGVVIAFQESKIAPTTIATGAFGYMHWTADPHMTEIGYVQSSPGPTALSHQLDRQRLLPFQTLDATNPPKPISSSSSSSSSSVLLTVRSTTDEHYLTIDKPSEMRLFSNDADMVGVTLADGSAMILMPQMPSSDLPFPTTARFLALLSVQDPTTATATATMVKAIVKVSAADGSFTISTKDGTDLFIGKLVAADKTQWPEKLIDRCYGTFVAASNDGTQRLVAQFADDWCLFSCATKHFLRGAALLIRK